MRVSSSVETSAQILRSSAISGVKRCSFFVAQLVLQRGPEIHGDGAQLDLDVHHFFLVGEEDRHRHDQMQAAVAVFLRIGDVVLAADQCDVVLLHERVGDAIDIVHQRSRPRAHRRRRRGFLQWRLR